MNRQVASRSQRRLEKKQALVLVVLGLVIALVSYGLGVVVGKSGCGTIIHEDLAASERIAIPVTDASVEGETLQPAEDATDPQLTFYDTLPEGKQPPMGSGINMPDQPSEPPPGPMEIPPAPEQAVVAVSKPTPTEVKPSLPVAKPQSQPIAKPRPQSQPIATVAPPPSVAPASAATGSYIIQVASVQKMDGAQDLMGRLSKGGYPAFVEKTDLGSKGVWFRVYVGPFASKSSADGAASTLRASRLASSPIVGAR